MTKPDLFKTTLLTIAYSGMIAMPAAGIEFLFRHQDLRAQERLLDETSAEVKKARARSYNLKPAEAYDYDSMNRQRGK